MLYKINVNVKSFNYYYFLNDPTDMSRLMLSGES